MKFSDVNEGKERPTNLRVRLSYCYQPANAHRRAQNMPETTVAKKMAIALPQVIRGYPGQFMIKRPDTADSDDNMESDQWQDYSATYRHILPSPRVNTVNDWLNFSDKDYVMPSHVRDILLSEGVGSTTVDSWLQNREGRHKRAQAMQHYESLRPRRESRVRPLPPLHKDTPLVSQHTSTRTTSYVPSTEPLVSSVETPDAQTVVKSNTSILEAQNLSGSTPEEVTSQSPQLQQLREPDQKWLTEQNQERQLMQGTTRPRLVIISSKVPRCISMTRAVKKDGHVLFVVYDFETWSFNDIISECQFKLDDYMRGCRAQSILIFCNGGPGYMYLLKHYVLTSQKIFQPQYHRAREFWHCLGQLISKLTPESACIHVIGCQLQGTKQAELLKTCLDQVIEPNRVKIESISEDDADGRTKIGFYFNYRKYLLWRCKSDVTQPAVNKYFIYNSLDPGSEDTLE
ncbi:NMDA receptor synaptonuclear signaling and neuronal migration factor [Biomphalaria glabrata]